MSGPDFRPMLALVEHLMQLCSDAGIDPDSTTLDDWINAGVLVPIQEDDDFVRMRFVPEAVEQALAQIKRQAAARGAA